MNKRNLWLSLLSLMTVFILSACTDDERETSATSSDDEQNTHEDMNMEEESMEDMMDSDSMDNEHMDHDEIVSLTDSTGENELIIPPVLKSNNEEKTEYTLRAQTGQTEIFDGVQTKTYGYNGSFLGPMLQFKKGDTVTINLVNELDEDTTFHWHGLEVPGNVDGGPHNVLKPGEESTIEFEVTQEAATLWFHPHPKGKTSEQVYNGLAGLIYINDENSENLGLPNDYGENDIPLIFQDRVFDDEKQLNYKSAANEDGTVGNTSLINGTLNPKLTVNKEKVRLRLLNGSNARNYTFKLNTDAVSYTHLTLPTTPYV